MAKEKMMHQDYDTISKKVIPNYKGLMKLLAMQIKPSDKKILELGIGTGNLAKEIIKKNPNIVYTGIDIKKEYLDIAKQKLKKSIQFIEGDILKKEFIKRSDVIISSLVIHHFSNKELKFLFNKIKTSLKNKGRFIVLEIIRGKDKNEAEKFENNWFDFMILNGVHENLAKKIIKEDTKIKTKKQILDIMKKAGFRFSITYEKDNLLAYIAEARK